MRLVNLRTPLLLVIALSFGIVFAVVSIFRIWYFCLIVCLILLACLILLFCFCKTKRTLRLISATIFMFCIGALCVVSYESNFRQNQFSKPTAVTMSGYVTEGSTFNDNYNNLILRDCVIYQDDNTEYKLNGNVRTTIFLYGNENNIVIGTEIVIYGTISTAYTVTTSNIDTWSYRNNIRYLVADTELLAIGDVSPTLSELFRTNLYALLQQTMPQSYDIAYALITGDKSLMTDVDKDAFRQAGIIHILAVSGLHIGFVASAITFILRKLRLPFWVYAPIVLASIIFYAYLCGFPPSVIRAVVMSFISLLVYRLHGMVDILNSMSISAIIILLIKPLYLFDAGFIMSFSSVYGICCTTQFTRRLLVCRDNIPKFVHKIFNSLAVSIGATLATLPAVAYFYGEVPLLGLLVNPIIVPVVAICFVWILLFVAIPYVNVTLAVPDMLLRLISNLCKWISSLSFATIIVSMVIVGTILLIIWLFILGGFVNIHGKARRYTLLVLALVCLALFIFPASETATVRGVTIVEHYGEGVAVVTDTNGKAYILGSVESVGMASKIAEFLLDKGVKNSFVVCTNLNQLNSNALAEISESVPIDKIYTYSSATNDTIQQNYKVLHLYEDMEYSNITFGALRNGVVIGLYVEFDSVRLGIINGDNIDINGNIYKIIKNLDWVLCSQENVECLSQVSSDIKIVCPFDMGENNIYGLNKYGNFTII